VKEKAEKDVFISQTTGTSHLEQKKT
jgi:hypothetical protein